MLVVDDLRRNERTEKNLWISPAGLDGGSPVVRLADLLARYGRDVSPTKRGAAQERYKLGMISRSSLAALPLHQVTPGAVVAYRDARLAEARRSTVRQEMSLIRRTLDAARLAWGHPLAANPLDLVEPLPQGPLRGRRVTKAEMRAIVAHLGQDQVASSAVRFALETRMDLAALLALTWAEVRSPDAAPLPENGRAILRTLAPTTGRIFPIEAYTLRRAWQRACHSAGVIDLRLRDLKRGVKA